MLYDCPKISFGKGLVITILGMCMIMYPARTIIAQVSPDDSNYSQGKQPVLVFVPYLLGYKESNTYSKNNDGCKTVVVPAIAMPERISTNGKRQEYHKILKTSIMDDVHP